MELDINGDVLLIGEANFSFSLSLAQTYCEANHITATCYESQEEAKRKYGTDLIATNASKLLELKCRRVLFQIDACKLEEHFADEQFARIIFMFPHVSGRSNLKKNRELIDKFLCSARKLMRKDSCVFIALAKGQGGTSFEEDPLKRNNKDSWQVLQIAAKHGLILTQCYEYDESRFNAYKSTGFRNQSKSFATQSGLVHKFELSLPILPLLSINVSNFQSHFLEKSMFFIQNCIASNQSTIHPLNQISKIIAHNLSKSTRIDMNLIQDKLKFNLKHSDSNQFGIVDQSLIEHFQIELPTEEKYFLRNSILDSFNFLNKIDNYINIFSGLAASSRQVTSCFQAIEQLNNINHETLIHFSSTEPTFTASAEQIRASLVSILRSMLGNKAISESNGLVCVDTSNNQARQLARINVDLAKQEFIAVVETSLLATVLYDLKDERLLYSDDERNFVPSINSNNSELTRLIKPFSIENVKWHHDISFWYDPIEFNYTQFIDTVNETCLGLVKSVRLLETYEEPVAENCKRYAVCFRLEYVSCDRAISWNDSVQLQYSLRDKVKLFNKIILR